MNFIVAPEYFKKRIASTLVFGARMITVLLADDHVLILNSLRTLLDAVDDIQVVAMAPDGVEAVVQSSLYCPEVLVIDISMQLMDGIEAPNRSVQFTPTHA